MVSGIDFFVPTPLSSGNIKLKWKWKSDILFRWKYYNENDHKTITGITPFAEQINFDLLASNLITSTDTFVEGVHFKRSVVKVINGVQVNVFI